MSQAPLTCPKCGSQHFERTEYRRYRQGYSATPGGELSAVSAPFEVWQCLCGEILTLRIPRSVPPEERGPLQDSIDRAVRRRQSLAPESLLAELKKVYVLRSEYEAQLQTIRELSAAMKALPPGK